jgi:hypothetical protein
MDLITRQGPDALSSLHPSGHTNERGDEVTTQLSFYQCIMWQEQAALVRGLTKSMADELDNPKYAALP